MTAVVSEPLEVVATDGIVAVFVDSTTAHELAEAWELAHATAHLDDSRRPLYLLDCAALKNAAIAADLQNGQQPVTAAPLQLVRVLEAVPA